MDQLVAAAREGWIPARAALGRNDGGVEAPPSLQFRFAVQLALNPFTSSNTTTN
jgi:hypothetical protein